MRHPLPSLPSDRHGYNRQCVEFPRSSLFLLSKKLNITVYLSHLLKTGKENLLDFSPFRTMAITLFWRRQVVKFQLSSERLFLYLNRLGDSQFTKIGGENLLFPSHRTAKVQTWPLVFAVSCHQNSRKEPPQCITTPNIPGSVSETHLQTWMSADWIVCNIWEGVMNCCVCLNIERLRACVEVLMSGCEVPAIFPNAYIVSYLSLQLCLIICHHWLAVGCVEPSPPPLPHGGRAGGIIVLPWPLGRCVGGGTGTVTICIYIYICVCIHF